jgi:hypothetical protein
MANILIFLELMSRGKEKERQTHLCLLSRTLLLSEQQIKFHPKINQILIEEMYDT